MKTHTQATPTSTPRGLLLGLGLCLLLSLGACTTTPVDSAADNAANLLERQQQQFAQGKQLFLDKQYLEAANLLLPLAQQGHIEAQYTIGYMYHYGHGLPRNEKESLRWITTAAARGHPLAQQALAILDASREEDAAAIAPTAPVSKP
ncbi:MAG: hypothetical protein RRB22_08560 [Gammaproteobacteria bacterium]|nr:hypothetical protein [Gammaproteobacteria bacterium]